MLGRPVHGFGCLAVAVVVGWVVVAGLACTQAPAASSAAEGAPSSVAERVHVDVDKLPHLGVRTVKAEGGALGSSVSMFGELRLSEDHYAEVGTSIPGRVRKVLVAPGDRVRSHQPLVELESLEVGRARAAHLTARARHLLAEKTLERKRTLLANQVLPKREVEVAQAEHATAEAELEASRASLSALGVAPGSGAGFSLSSPIEGTVMERRALLGRLVDEKEPLFIIANLAKLWLVVHAFERDAGAVALGARALVSFPALPGSTRDAEVTWIGSRVDPISRTVEIRVLVSNEDGALRPGLSATAQVTTEGGSGAGVTVPVAALQRHPEGWCVFLPTDQPGTFAVRVVERGRERGDRVEVPRGLAAGEEVVVDGAFVLKAEADKTRGGDTHPPHT